ncbi:MAG: hypothetical protein M1812_005241 [Candelaria pacifica]|nr:MAG: hypothetical protein M1812_005241 [Candelaria pacifica]
MHSQLKCVLSFSLLFTAHCSLSTALYTTTTTSRTASQELIKRPYEGPLIYPYHGAFGNKPPNYYKVTEDPLGMNGRDLTSVSRCSKALGQPKHLDCERLIARLDWKLVQTAFEQGVQAEHLEEHYMTLPRTYSFGTCVVGLRIMPNPKYALDVDIAAEWVIKETAIRIKYVCLRRTMATVMRPAADGSSNKDLPGLAFGGWQIQGIYKRINVTLFEKRIYQTDTDEVELNSPRVLNSCEYRAAMGISSETCPEITDTDATETEEDDDYDQPDGNGPDFGGSGDGGAGGSDAGASREDDPGPSGSGATRNDANRGSLQPWAFNTWPPISEWPLSCIMDKQPSYCAEGFQCVPKDFQSSNVQLFFGVLASAATNLLSNLGTCWVLGPSS